jgi:hypothetical protein
MKTSTFASTLLVLSLVACAQAALSAAKARKDGFTPLAAKKGGSGVDMAYRIEGTPAVGSPLTIRVTMASSADAQVTVRAGDGLTLNRPDQVLTAPAGQTTEHTITVVPQAEGRFY